MATEHSMFYGEPGSGKTRAIIQLIKEVLSKTDKHIRIYVGDGSRYSYEVAGLLDNPRVHLMDFSALHWPMSTTNFIAEGNWPLEPENPATKWRPLTAEEVTSTGLWVFEGASVMAYYVLGNIKGGLAEQSGRGIKIGQDSPIKIRDAEVKKLIVDPQKDDKITVIYEEGTGTGMTFGGNPMSHYNVGQRHMQGIFQRTRRLPGIVLWTGHERTSEDGNTGERVISVDCAGKAISASLPALFSNTLHFTIASKVDRQTDATTGKTVGKAKQEYRIYVVDHYDPDGITPLKYKAVNRAPDPSVFQKEYLTGGPGEAIMKFYELMAESTRRFKEA